MLAPCSRNIVRSLHVMVLLEFYYPATDASWLRVKAEEWRRRRTECDEVTRIKSLQDLLLSAPIATSKTLTAPTRPRAHALEGPS